MLGTSLLFWGAMTGRPFIGLVAALVVEARHWMRIRWEFDDDAYGRAWQFTSIAIALAAVLIWLDGSRYTALPGLLSWMPPLLLPMQFVQAYGMRDSLPLGMFSFLARQRRERNRRLGLTEESTEFNFGNVLFATTLVAASVGSKADTWWFLPGLVVLTGWILLSAGRSSAAALIPALAVAGLLGLAGQVGLERAEEWIGRTSNAYNSRFDPNYSSTLIGSSGTVEQSRDIVWRLRPMDFSPVPNLLRTATFNTYLGTNWQNQRVAKMDFKDVDSRLVGADAFYLLQDAGLAGRLPGLPHFRLRGGATSESPLPLPGDVAGLRDFDLDGMDRNSFGTVRITPKQAVVDGMVFWKGGTNPESPPIENEDRRIPIAEKDTIHGVVRNLDLDSEPDLKSKLAAVRTWFRRNFRYTRNLTIQLVPKDRTGDFINQPTAITRFLTKERAGHCEYFATAATLILRDAGIPTRYTTGFAVMERDEKRGEFLIRGVHGHAWCRVWDASQEQWVDFDPTPPDWVASISEQPTAMQRFNDALKCFREDFFVWRNRPANRLAVSLVMMAIGLALAVFVLRRLWKSKRRIETRSPIAGYEGPLIRTPLHDIEGLARKQLGQRPPGLPFAAWLKHLRARFPETPELDEAIALHQRLRFDPEPAPDDDRERLVELTERLETRLKQNNR